MNREIKFRYHYLTEGAGSDAAFGREIDGILFENGAVSEVLIDGDPWPVAKDEHGECGVLCQYTGLKDRNGKEIYEGDIIRRWHEEWKDGVSRGMAEDRWDFQLTFHGHVLVCKGTNPSVHHPMDMDWDYVHGDEDYHDAVVIGNIHENPDLLK